MNNKILIVDDDIDILDSVKEILEMENFVVNTTTKGNNTIDLARILKPNLILLDLLLSGRDGGHICREIKKDLLLARTAVIIMSAHPSAKKQAQEAGADDFIAKPFDLNDLLDILNKHLNIPVTNKEYI